MILTILGEETSKGMWRPIAAEVESVVRSHQVEAVEASGCDLLGRYFWMGT